MQNKLFIIIFLAMPRRLNLSRVPFRPLFCKRRRAPKFVHTRNGLNKNCFGSLFSLSSQTSNPFFPNSIKICLLKILPLTCKFRMNELKTWTFVLMIMNVLSAMASFLKMNFYPLLKVFPAENLTVFKRRSIRLFGMIFAILLS